MPASLRKVKTVQGVTEYRLQNGLTVLHKNDSTLPLVAICVTYHVGSRNEAKGHTGSTHILEHLLFKDSENFNRLNGKSITTYLEWMGAATNATTWLDRTNYFELLPRERAEEALAMEADRMRNSLFTDEDLAVEMPVVRNEYEIGRNNPFELLDEKMMEAAFAKHQYRIPTIGSKEDIEAANAKKLRNFYNTFYWPNNATIAIFGSISKGEMKKLVLRHFGPLPRSERAIPPMTAKEPTQKAPRFQKVTKSGGVTIAALLYKIPEGRHEDFPALLLLATILAGGFSSRLQRTLVDAGLAADISVSIPPLHDPGVLTFLAHVTEGTDPHTVLDIIRAETAGMSPVSKAEFKRAQERIVSQFAYERDGIFAEIRALSEAVAAGDWTLGIRLESAVKQETAARISGVAKKYFLPQGETAGILVPHT